MKHTMTLGQRKPIFWLNLMLVFSLLLLNGSVTARPLNEATGSTDTLSFQGQLTDSSGQPLTGSYDMRFSIFNALSAGTAVWGPETHSAVSVSAGLFVVQLGSSSPISPTVFDGGDRWVEIAVSTGSAWETLAPRLPIASAAYAINANSLPAGTTISGNNDDGVLVVTHGSGTRAPNAARSPDSWFGSSALVGETTSHSAGASGVTGYASAAGRTLTSGATYGVYGKTNNSTNLSVGVYGEATAETGSVYGMYGKTQSDGGIGVYGEATYAGNATTYGVYGNTSSETGIGVVGEALPTNGKNYGVKGKTNSASAEAAGVYGVNRSSGGDQLYGVWGEIYTSGNNSAGVYGKAFHILGKTYGVWGVTESETAGSAGVYAQALNEKGETYGVWAETNGDSEGSTGVVGIANGTTYQTYGVHGETSSSGDFSAGVIGLSLANAGQNYGVRGDVHSSDDGASAVYGYAHGTEGATYAVRGVNMSHAAGAIGVSGVAEAPLGQTYGVYGLTKSNSDHATGVYGRANANTGTTVGVRGEIFSASDGATGVYGYANTDSGVVVGVKGETQSASTGATGVYGEATATTGATYGVYGKSNSPNSNAVYGEATHGGVAVKASSDTGNVIEGYGSSGLVFRVSNDGNVYADGEYRSPAADFAEMLPAVDDLEPGDVLAIGPDGRVILSSADAATTIIGVYSTDPAFLGGHTPESTEGRVPVAIVGVVPVKVSAENGPIRPNDPLSLSPTLPGYAAKAVPLFVLDSGEGVYAGGTILGRALEGLDSGEGIILVLLQLS